MIDLPRYAQTKQAREVRCPEDALRLPREEDGNRPRAVPEQVELLPRCIPHRHARRGIEPGDGVFGSFEVEAQEGLRVVAVRAATIAGGIPTAVDLAVDDCKGPVRTRRPLRPAVLAVGNQGGNAGLALREGQQSEWLVLLLFEAAAHQGAKLGDPFGAARQNAGDPHCSAAWLLGRS